VKVLVKNLLGTFDCQGELDENLAQKLLNHPDANEIERARLFAKEIVKKVGTI
jgi:hypothetical protein